MNNRSIIQLIIVFTSVVLGMILYPILLRKWKQFVDWLYKITYGQDGKSKSDKIEKIVSKPDNSTSIIGESKTIIGHSRTNTATNLKSENSIEKESTFVPESKDDNPPMNHIDAPLEKVESLPEEEFDGEAEQEELETEPDAVLASGASYEELEQTNHTIAGKQTSLTDQEEAGRVLYENRQTEMIEQVIANSEETAQTIASLIDTHLAMRAQRLREQELIDEESAYPNDFKDFDFNSIF